MKKRILALTIVAIMLIALLAACTTDDETTPATDTDIDADTTETVEHDGDQIPLEFWHIQTISPRVDIIADSVERFMDANPQYDVNIVPIMNDVYKDRILIAMGAGEVPDVFMSWSGGPMIEYINAGHIADITDEFNASGRLDLYLEGGIAQATYNGRIWGVPTESIAVAAVWYNMEIFERYGLSVPNTIGELEDVAEALVENGIIPFALANGPRWTGSMYYMYLATRYGGLEPFLQAVTGENDGTFEHPAFEFAGNRIQDWVERGFFAPGFNANDEDAGQSRELLYAELAAMHVMGNWFVGQMVGENEEFMERMGVFPFPAYENSSADPNIAIGTAGDNFYHVSTTSPSHLGAFNLIMQLLDEQAVTERIAAGAIPPLRGIEPEVPLARDALAIMQRAPAVQLWYDQFLPPEVAQVHLNTSQAIFGLTMTPQEANAAMQEAIEAYRAG